MSLVDDVRSAALFTGFVLRAFTPHLVVVLPVALWATTTTEWRAPVATPKEKSWYRGNIYYYAQFQEHSYRYTEGWTAWLKRSLSLAAAFLVASYLADVLVTGRRRGAALLRFPTVFWWLWAALFLVPVALLVLYRSPEERPIGQVITKTMPEWKTGPRGEVDKDAPGWIKITCDPSQTGTVSWRSATLILLGAELFAVTVLLILIRHPSSFAAYREMVAERKERKRRETARREEDRLQQQRLAQQQQKKHEEQAQQEKEQETEQQDQRERRRGGRAIRELTEWFEEQKAIIKKSVRDPAARDEALLILEQRYDELLKQQLREMRP